MIVYLSILVAIIGLILYFVSGNAKVQECGRIAYFCGLLAFLLKAGEPLIKLLGGP